MKPIGALGVSAAIVAIAAAVGYNVIYAPHAEQVRLTQTQLLEEQATQQLQADTAALLQEVEQYRSQLAAVPDPSEVVREVMTLAQETGVTLDNIAQDVPQEFPHFTRLTISLQATASYHQLGTFLDRLERASQFLRVERFTVNAEQSDAAPSIRLVISTLYLPMPGERRSAEEVES